MSGLWYFSAARTRAEYTRETLARHICQGWKMLLRALQLMSIRSCYSRTKVKSHALLAAGMHALDNWRPLSLMILINRLAIVFDFPCRDSPPWHFIGSTFDIYWNFLFISAVLPELPTSALISVLPTRMISCLLWFDLIFQDRPGDTGRRGWLLQVHYVRRELHGGPAERDQRGGPELADEGLLARLGVQFHRHPLRNRGDWGKTMRKE